MVKKVNIGNRPTNKNIDNWVGVPNGSDLPVEEIKMKRLTLDIPESLHKAIKRKATDEGVAMVDMLRELLEKYYG